MAGAYQCDEDPVIVRLRREIAKEQVSHPVAEYSPERVERLVEQMSLAHKWQSPVEVVFNF